MDTLRKFRGLPLSEDGSIGTHGIQKALRAGGCEKLVLGGYR